MEENQNTGKRIIPVDLSAEMKKSFISYAMAVIINRALPDVRDGLKPVHRRVLYGMYELGVTPDKPTKKCARIVGDVMGKYHPHGDSSIYDTLVRMAQDFSMRYMLARGQGNFGSIDGDPAAAMRYTEAKLSPIAMEMLRDIDKETVDFYPNFDETLMQPVTLPSRFPNLLVNGTGGIAVGMATNIPPHNLGEIVAGASALLDNPDMDVEELMEYIPGPDFPTGGVICGLGGIRQAYRTGRGRIRVRAKTEIETIKEHDRIIITDVPYQVNKELMVTNIRQLAHDRKIDGIAEVNDESAENIRVVIDLKKGANASVVLNRLFKHTQMQTTFGVIMLALVDGEPRTLSLKDALVEYIKYQEEIILRRTRYDLERAEKRAHIVEGLLKALDIIDEIIALIRSSSDTATARNGLIEQFGFSEVQAQAILEMRLQRLTGLEKARLDEEFAELCAKIQYFKDVLANENMVKDIIRKDLAEIRDKYGDPRRTEITPEDDEIDLDELIQEEEMVVTLSHQGYIKRIPADTYRAQKRGGKGIAGLSTKEEDFPQEVFASSTHRQLLFFTNKGKVYMKKCYMLPEGSRMAKGSAIVNLLNLEGEEKVAAVFPLRDFENGNLLFITEKGIVKKTPLLEYCNIRQNGLIAINIREDDRLINVIRTSGDNAIMLGTRGGMCITFHESDVRPMGRVATGVRGIQLRAGDSVVEGVKVNLGEDILTITEKGYGKRTPSAEFREQKRGGTGLKVMTVTEKTGALCGLKSVDGEEDIILINDANVIIRLNSGDVSQYGRSAQGVRLMKVAEDTSVVCVAKLPREEGDAEEANDPAESEAAQSE